MTKLDRAIVLAQLELAALKAQDVDKAADLMEERRTLLLDAYEQHDENSHKEYLVKLIAMQSYNMQILEVGNELRNSLRKSIQGNAKTVHAAGKYMRASL